MTTIDIIVMLCWIVFVVVADGSVIEMFTDAKEEKS